MTLWKCGTWTYAALLRQNCVKCAGKGCVCCEEKGKHAEPGAKNQRDNINPNFAQTNVAQRSKNAIFAKRSV